MKENYRIKIEPLTAVHIGTGNTLSLLDYKLANTSSGMRKFVRFSSDSILNRIATDEKLRKEFEKFSLSNDVKSLQTFFHENMKNDDILYFCVPTKEFEKKYDENVKKSPLQNASEVLEMYRSAQNQFPVIPGSSIKGAIRTAILNTKLCEKSKDEIIIKLKNEFSQKTKGYERKNFESVLQKALLGKYCDAKSDPFRCIQISDCKLLSATKNQIIGLLKNVSYNKNNENLEPIEKLQIQAECISGMLMNNKILFEGIISVDKNLLETNQIKMDITMNDIINDCNNFLLEEFNNELRNFYSKETEDTELINSLVDEIQRIVNNTNKNTFILRIGRWSQVEFVTFAPDFRKPKTPIDKKTYAQKGWGKTRTVFNYDGQYLPMGWCKCSIEKLI